MRTPCFYVMEERCKQCLYGSDKIVSDARRKQILNDLHKNGNHFLCHKGTELNRDVACRGDFEQRGCGLAGRLAQALNIVTPVAEADIVTTVPENNR